MKVVYLKNGVLKKWVDLLKPRNVNNKYSNLLTTLIDVNLLVNIC